jgi:RNA polymerase sigma-70 factor (ECF subfamily)
VPSELETQAVSGHAGGPDDFDSFFIAHYARLARLLYRVVGDIPTAEELASEAFWRLHTRPPKSEQNLFGWLYRTGLHLALDSLKKRRRRAQYEARAGLPDAPPSPFDNVQSLERRDRVRKALAALRPEQISLLTLRSEGYSLAEIASVLSLNPGSTGTLLARADAALRKEYLRLYGIE